jgi:hypothetical protein
MAFRKILRENHNFENALKCLFQNPFGKTAADHAMLESTECWVCTHIQESGLFWGKTLLIFAVVEILNVREFHKIIILRSAHRHMP